MSAKHAGVAGFATAALLCLSACAGFMSEADLYDRLGGKPAITAVIDDFVGNVERDERIKRFFVNVNIPRLKLMLVDQICETTGGPCTYTGRDMKAAHAGMHISEEQFNAFIDDLAKSLDKLKVPAREQKDLLAVLGPMKADIVGQ